MYGLNTEETQELLEVIEFSKIQKEFWEVEEKFKIAQNKISSLEPSELEKYFTIYNDNYDEIEKTFYQELKDSQKASDEKSDERDLELSIEMISVMKDYQIKEFAYRVMSLDYYGIEFDNFEIVKEYVVNDLDIQKSIIYLNNYLNKFRLLYDDEENKIIGEQLDIIKYICELYPPVSKYTEISNISLHIMNQVLGGDNEI